MGFPNIPGFGLVLADMNRAVPGSPRFSSLAAHVVTRVSKRHLRPETVLSKVSYDLWANTSVMIVSSKGTWCSWIRS